MPSKINEDSLSSSIDRLVADPPRPFKASKSHLKHLHPAILELQKIIEDDPEIYVLLHKAFEQIPNTKSTQLDPLGRALVRDYDSLLLALDAALSTPPAYTGPGRILTGLPFGSVLNALMGTVSGAAFFLNTKITQQFDQILSAWAAFLITPASLSVVNESETGWLCPTARRIMLPADGVPFEDEYDCKPTLPHYGYTSWDDFFTRTFRPRPPPKAPPSPPPLIFNFFA